MYKFDCNNYYLIKRNEPHKWTNETVKYLKKIPHLNSFRNKLIYKEKQIKLCHVFTDMI